MKPGTDQIFYSKILLFGEYSLMFGSMALSIPFNEFGGRFTYNPDFKLSEIDIQSKFNVEDYLDYLDKIDLENSSGYFLNINQLRSDIENGYVFESNIPVSYGLGSSGALVAAIFERYGSPQLNDINNIDQLHSLKEYLSKLESYFHGKSSGLDPLISFLGRPLLMNLEGQIELIKTPQWDTNNQGALFLVDSKTSSETQPLVDLFHQKCEYNYFLNEIKTTYIPTVNRCIGNYLKKETPEFHHNIRKLSELQLKLFREMIPENFHSIWKTGLDSGKYSLKLCGSGGGGMMIGFTKDFRFVRNQFSDHKLLKVHPL